MYVVSVLLSKAMYHLCATRTASDPAERDSLGNNNMSTVYPTPYGSSMKKARLIIRTVTACEIRVSLYLIPHALCRCPISTAALDFFPWGES